MITLNSEEIGKEINQTNTGRKQSPNWERYSFLDGGMVELIDPGFTVVLSFGRQLTNKQKNSLRNKERAKQLL